MTTVQHCTTCDDSTLSWICCWPFPVSQRFKMIQVNSKSWLWTRSTAVRTAGWISRNCFGTAWKRVCQAWTKTRLYITVFYGVRMGIYGVRMGCTWVGQNQVFYLLRVMIGFLSGFYGVQSGTARVFTGYNRALHGPLLFATTIFQKSWKNLLDIVCLWKQGSNHSSKRKADPLHSI